MFFCRISRVLTPEIAIIKKTKNSPAHVVNIVGPITVSEGNLISVVTAEPVHFLNPVFQFWIELPGGSYESSGPYSAHTHFTFTATSPGTFHVKLLRGRPTHLLMKISPSVGSTK